MTRARFGLTWWGQRWIAALEALGAMYANRLPRGRTYARKGTVSDLDIVAGQVTARVQGSRARPYRVALRLPTFDDGAWEAVTVALAGQIRHAAALLDGQMPADVDEVLAGCGVSLFPRPGDLATTCSCPDWANPCKHVAAVHYVLAQAFDADPFLLPALRGRDRDALLAGLRAVRAGVAAVEVAAASDQDSMPIASLVAADLWDASGDLAAIAVQPALADEPAATLRRLGPPPGFGAAGASEDLLYDLVSAAAQVAWRLATDTDDDTDPLLTALRQRGSATTRDLATALDLPIIDIRARLAPHLASGLVRRTGHARTTRYHA